MDFKTYFMALTVADRAKFAERCGTSRQHLTNIAYGLKPVSEKLAINIERESSSKVSVETLRPDVDWAVVRRCECGKAA